MTNPMPLRDERLSIRMANPWPLALLAGMAGLIGLLWATPWGIGVLHDSVFYLDTAANLQQGHGLVWTAGGGELRPLTHFPPGYPLAVALWGLTGLAPVTAARLYSAGLFGLNVALLGFAVFRVTGRAAASILASVVGLASPAFLGIHLLAMSEPQYLALHLLAVILIVEYLRINRIPLLVGSAVLAALAGLTRYIGVTTLVAVLLLLLIFRGNGWRKKLRDLGIYSLVGAGPLMLLLVRNATATQALTNRVFSFNPIDYERRRMAQDVISQWFLPEAIPYTLRVRVAALILFLILSALAWWLISTFLRHRRSQARQYPLPFLMSAALATYCGVYAGSLLLSAVTLDASTRWDDRILTPLLQSIVILAFITIASWPSSGRIFDYLRYIPLVAAAVLAITYTPQSLAIAKQMRADGLGFTGREWSRSATVEWVRNLSEPTVIYSNEAQALLFLTQQEPFYVPEKINPVTGREREDLSQELARMRGRLADGGFLVLFHPDQLRAEMPPLATLLENLREHISYADATVYRGR